MSRKSLIGLLCLSVLFACSDNPNAVKLFNGRTSSVVTSTLTLDQSVDQLISLFPKDLGARNEQRIQRGQNEDLNPRATWISIKRKYAAGASNPAELAAAKKELFRLSNWVTRNAQEMNPPPDGETKTAAAARLVLYMSLYVYGGPATPPPSFTPAADAIVGIVTPNAPATIVTPTLHAGVQLEAGSVAENTVIVVTQNPTPYPENCSGPLQTRLCQYPQFYTFEMFPHKRLLKAAKFNVCHVNSGGKRFPLADHDRFRLAHAKPADPADYTPGSTIRDKNGESIEILPLVAQTFSTCSNSIYASNSGRSGPLGAFSRLAIGLRNLVSPRTAYAVDVGLGGLSRSMSPFNDVDPLGLPDRSARSLSVDPISLHAGEHVGVTFTVENTGTATATPVPGTLRLTSADIVEGPPPLDLLLATVGIPVLAPGATHTTSGVDLIVPETVQPGRYNIRLMIGDDPLFPETSLANNGASTAITITKRGLSITATDLGTLGGSGWSDAFAINIKGQVVGWSNNNNFLWEPSTGRMRFLGNPWGDWNAAYDINAKGQVAGRSAYVGWVWDPVLGMRAVPTTPTPTGLLCKYGAFGLNDDGLVVGAEDNCRFSQPYAWTSSTNTYARIPGVDGFSAWRVNRLGIVLIATSWLNQFPYGPAGGFGTSIIYSLRKGAISYVPSLGGATFAYGLNDSSDVVGGSINLRGHERAFLWKPRADVMRDLGTLGGLASEARAVNNRGQVVGWSTTAAGETHAFIWDERTNHMTDLGTLPGYTASTATGLNDANPVRIVGTSGPNGQVTTERATLWTVR